MNIVIDSVSLYGLSLRREQELLMQILMHLGRELDYKVTVLDRGNINLSFDVNCLPFPNYSPNRFNAEDSILVQKVCNHIGADLFLSEISTPLTTPMILVTAENYQGQILRRRSFMELALAIAFCDAIICGASELKEPLDEIYSPGVSKLIHSMDQCCAVIENIREEKIRQDAGGSDSLARREWSRLRVLQAAVDVEIWDDEES